MCNCGVSSGFSFSVVLACWWLELPAVRGQLKQELPVLEEALLLPNLPSKNDYRQWALFADLFYLMALRSGNLRLLIFLAVSQDPWDLCSSCLALKPRDGLFVISWSLPLLSYMFSLG